MWGVTMTETVTLQLPEELARQARVVAEQRRRPVEEVLVEWIRQAGAAPVVELLPDGELLALCDSQLPAEQQEELSELLRRNREGEATDGERDRLEVLMRDYRLGMVRKAQALKTAVARGLRPRLN